MGFWENMEQRVTKFSFIDMWLIQTAGFLFGLFVMALVPRLMDVSPWWYLVLCFLINAKLSRLQFGRV